MFCTILVRSAGVSGWPLSWTHRSSVTFGSGSPLTVATFCAEALAPASSNVAKSGKRDTGDSLIEWRGRKNVAI